MPAKREDRIKEITERLEQGIRELFTSERYTEYLQTMSQFHHYSFNNTVLIAMQKPDATLVAGYQAWQKKFNRHVKRGEKGIQIIAPAPIREKYEVEKIDPVTQEPVLREDGQPETEEVEHIIPRFRVSTVFDVSQTEGEPLPELIEGNLTANVENFDYFMQAIRAVSPVPIRFDEIPTDANGYYSLTDKEIVIQSGMSESQTMKTAIHEVTHAMLHDRDTMALLGEEKDQITRETEAESVAYTVCQFFGLDTSDYSFPYVASWSSSMELKELRESMDTIRKTAGDFIESMTEQLRVLMQEQSMERQTLTAAQQAQRLVDESPFRSQFSPEEVDLVISYAHKFDDVELARSLLTRIERGIQEAEPLMIEEAEQEARDWIDRLPDREIGLAEMHEYGYHQDDMYPLTKESALELHRMGFKIYCLEPDGTAGEFASRKMIEAHHGIFGIHRGDWNQELERPNEEIMENSAYLHPPMTALEKEAALEFFDAGETVYLITTNPIPIPADNRMEIERGSDEFQVSVDSFEKIRHYREEMQKHPELRSLREANLFLNEEDQYGIYQVREDSAAREYQFMPLDYVQEKGFHLDYEDFNLVYSGHLYPGDTLDGIYEKFNIDHPEDFTGHSLSVSDVVVLKKDGELTAYYVDRFGFPVLENFLPALDERTEQITMDSSGIRVDGHEGTWHPVEMQEINGTVFYLMEHDTFGSSVAKVAVDQNGRLAAEDLWNGFDEGAREAIAEFLDSADQEKVTGQEMKEPFISRYYVVNDAYGIKAERVYQYFENLDEALTAYHQLPNHFDKQIGMESTEQPPSQMSLITCRNGMETLTDIETVSLSEKWVREDVMDAKNKAEFYLDNRDTEIAFQIKGEKGYFFIQTSADGEYDYTFYGRDFRELDGGTYDASDLSTQEAIDNILADEKGLLFSACEVIDCEKFLETAERAEYFPQKSYETLKGIMDSGRDEIAFQCGYGYASVQKIPEGYQYIIYDDKWKEIGGNIYDNPDASMEDVVFWIFRDERLGDLECLPLDYQDVIKGTLQAARDGLSESKLTPTSEISRREKALGGQSRHDIEETVLCYAQSVLEEEGLDEQVKLIAARVYGSRTREGLYSEDSDIDVVLSYNGDIREDDFFNSLHEHGMEIAGLKIDINPISTEKTGFLGAYMEQTESYLDQKEVKMLAADIDKFAYDHDFYEYQDHVEDREQSVQEVINELMEGKADSVKEWLQGFADEGEPGETVSGAQSLIGRIDTAIERNLLLPKEKAEPKISFYVAECMEFPVLGEYQDNLTLKAAFDQYQSIPADRMNGVKGIGFRLEDGSMYDGEYQLMSGGVISYDLIDLVPHYKESPLVQKAISELEEMLSRQKEQSIVSPQPARSEKEPDIPEEKKNSRKQSVLLALRARQEKQKAQEKDKEPRKTQTHKKGEQEL